MSKSIVKACVRYNNRLYTGFDHGECFKKLNEDNTILVHSDIEQGFVDSDGNFVDRKQAMIIAKESGQLRYEPDKKTLISEDLHLDWLNKQAQRIAELEEQLKNAIVPKFKIGQEIWEITPLMSWKIKRIEWHKFNGGNGDIVVEIYRLGHDRTDDYNCCIMPVDNDRFFATKEEAEAKLRELQGEKK